MISPPGVPRQAPKPLARRSPWPALTTFSGLAFGCIASISEAASEPWPIPFWAGLAAACAAAFIVRTVQLCDDSSSSDWTGPS